MVFEHGELILYETEDGQSMLDVRLEDETVWLSQAQMQHLFGRDQSVISRHVNNVFKDGELGRESNMQKMHIANSDKPVNFYNLDVIISVGYRVKSLRGTQFRIWATSVLKDHVVTGYTVNQQRLADKGFTEASEVLRLLQNTLVSQCLITDEGQAVLSLVNAYAKTWQLLWQYDADSLPGIKEREATSVVLEIEQARTAISSLKQELLVKNEATEIFGQERGEGLSGILGAIQQTFGGQELYLTAEEKAAHLLYFVIKDHPFVDGNKRIASFLFLLFLRCNKRSLLFDPNGLVALTLLVASSEASQKGLLIRLIINLLEAE